MTEHNPGPLPEGLGDPVPPTPDTEPAEGQPQPGGEQNAGYPNGDDTTAGDADQAVG